MRYLAILKDSLREARDGWVLLGLFVLSTFMIVLVGMMSFSPVSAERTMRLFFSPTPMVPPQILEALNKDNSPKLMISQMYWWQFQLEKVELVRGEPDSPLSDYALTVSANGKTGMTDIPGMPPMKMPKANSDEKAMAKKLETLFEDAHDRGFIKLGKIEVIENNAETGKMKFRVNLEGTPTTHRIWGTETSAVFGYIRLDWILGDLPLFYRIYKLAKNLIGWGSWLAVVFGIVVTAFFIPSMLRKGTIDMLLVKPITRWQLLVYKYLGGLTFMFLTTAYSIGGIWFVLGIRSGLWANGLLLLILTLTFFFAIVYAVSTFVGVVTRSIVMSILVTVFAYGAFALIGLANWGVGEFEKATAAMEKIRAQHGVEKENEIPPWVNTVTTIIKVISAVSPRTEDVNSLNQSIVYSGFLSGDIREIRNLDSGDKNWLVSFVVSAAWIAVFLGLAIAWFYYKDY